MTARGMDLHGPYRLLAAAAVDGRLDAEEAIALEGHLAGCSDCRSVQAGLWRDHRWLAEPGPAADPPPGIRAAVVEAARRPPARHADRTTRALLLAACLVVAVAGIATFGLRQRPATGSIPPTSGPQATASPTVVPTIAAPGAIGEGTLVGKEGTTASITFSVVVRGFHEDATGRVDFADPDGTRWTGTVDWLDYWWDPAGRWYVAFLEGCRMTEGKCRPFVMQLVDGRLRPDRHDEVSLTWATRTTYQWDAWELWYGLSSGVVEVAAPQGVHP